MNNKVYCVMQDKSRLIWAGTFLGVSMFEPEAKIEHYKSAPYNNIGLNENIIHGIYQDDEGLLWVGTNNSGVNIIDRDNDRIYDFSDICNNEGLSSNGINQISGHKNYIFISTDNGLNVYDKNTKAVKVYNVKDGLNAKRIRNTMYDKDGIVWIGTSGGLNKLDRKTEEFVSYTTLDGLPNNTVYGIVIDNNGDLWMSTNGGLSKFDPVNKTFHNLDVTDGIQSNEFNGHSYAKLKNGDLIFGGINGLNIFNPDKIMSTTYMPSVEFSTFKVNGKEVSDEWYPITENSIIFSNLKSGIYTFRIKAKNSLGEYSEENSLKFTIKKKEFLLC